MFGPKAEGLLMVYTAASHQEVIKMFWLDFEEEQETIFKTVYLFYSALL